MSTFQVVIHHNPDCGTSRNVLAIMRAGGYQPTVIESVGTEPGSNVLHIKSGRRTRNGMELTGDLPLDIGCPVGNDVFAFGSSCSFGVGEVRCA